MPEFKKLYTLFYEIRKDYIVAPLSIVSNWFSDWKIENKKSMDVSIPFYDISNCETSYDWKIETY